MKWDTIVAIADGNHSLASDNMIAALNTSRSVGDEPYMISQFVRWSLRDHSTRTLELALARSSKIPRLESIQAAWEADEPEPLLLHALRGERAIAELLCRGLEDGTIKMEEFIDGMKGRSFPVFDVSHPTLAADHAGLLRWFNGAVDAAKLPVHNQPAAFSAMGLPERTPDLFLTSLLVSDALKIPPSVHWRVTALIRCAIAGLACERFRLQNGRWPKSLGEIPTSILKGVPLDPFDGNPLRYKILDDGVVVYSIGKDLMEDGGEQERKSSGPDVGFQLWNPDRRGLPANP